MYTGWSIVHWNATGTPLVDPVHTGIPLGDTCSECLQGTLEHDWKKLVETVPHWNATEETLTIAAYTGTPLEGLQQPTHMQALHTSSALQMCEYLTITVHAVDFSTITVFLYLGLQVE